MREVIGIVRLAPGEVGYFDDLTRIHLTIANPQHPIYAGMNTTNIKRSVRVGRLVLVSGTLSVDSKAEDKAGNKMQKSMLPKNIQKKAQENKEPGNQLVFEKNSTFEVNIAHVQEDAAQLLFEGIGKFEINMAHNLEEKPEEKPVGKTTSRKKKAVIAKIKASLYKKNKVCIQMQ